MVLIVLPLISVTTVFVFSNPAPVEMVNTFFTGLG